MQGIYDTIIKWYQNKWENGKNLYPWRLGNSNPYNILIAEILLQHTTAKAIIGNNSYIIFLEKFPDIFALDKASLEELSDLFKPLGLYYQKPKRLKELTKIIIKNFDGKIPKSKQNLKKVPGIGDYIANAILTFAYGQNEVPLDNNLRRIALKAWDIKEKRIMIDFYKKLAEPNPKIVYWALFDIGRFHCRKPIPNCKGCPLNRFCKSKLI